ncbi:Ubiquitin fusion degradation protein 4 [Boothiomyces macroporosus]|uniref:Ubiquitin fusion degradation protein 4 n=1 Tax=Boothiomyces macroporosus TaxID=261099 RepID=A0AAD5UK31_9FUNG|nr:Ubiquitin fusion degradation protein 4 [Boothiomyces macroporosus]
MTRKRINELIQELQSDSTTALFALSELSELLLVTTAKKDSSKQAAIVDMLTNLMPPLIANGIWKISNDKEAECKSGDYSEFAKLIPELCSTFSTCNTFSVRKKVLILVCQIFQLCKPTDYKPYLKSVAKIVYETLLFKNTSQEVLAVYNATVLAILAKEADDRILTSYENEGLFVSMENKRQQLIKLLKEIQETKEARPTTVIQENETEESEDEDSQDEYDDYEMSTSITDLPKTTAEDSSSTEAQPKENEFEKGGACAISNFIERATSQIPKLKESNIVSRIKALQKEARPFNPLVTTWTSEIVLFDQLVAKSVHLLDQCLQFSQSDVNQMQIKLESLLLSIQKLSTACQPDENEIVHLLEKVKKIALYESTNYQVFQSSFIPTIVDFLTSPGTEDSHIFNIPLNQTSYTVPISTRIELFKKVFDSDCRTLESITHEFISKTDVYEFTHSTEYRYETISPSQINKHLRIILKSGENDGVFVSVPALGSVKTLQSYLKSHSLELEESDEEDAEIIIEEKSSGEERPNIESRDATAENAGKITGYNIFEQLDDVNMEEDSEDEADSDNMEMQDQDCNDLEGKANIDSIDSSGSKTTKSPKKSMSSNAIDMDINMDTSNTANATANDVEIDHRKSTKPSEITSEQSASTLKDDACEKVTDLESLTFEFDKQPILPGTTLFSAIFHALGGDLSKIWYKTHTIIYSPKKVETVKPEPFYISTSACRCSTCVDVLINLPTDFTTAPKIFQTSLLFLAILDRLYSSKIKNEKIVSKLNRQMADPILAISSLHPDWVWSLVYNYSFLLPFETRLKFFKITHLGNSRNLINWLDCHSLTDITQVRVDRKKVVVHRNAILEALEQVVNIKDVKYSTIEFEFHDEAGSGLGPTLEFYALVCKYFNTDTIAKRLWKHSEIAGKMKDAFHGLYPRPLKDASDVLSLFEILGTFCAKAICDSRYLDLQFNPLFLEQVFHCKPQTGANRNNLKALDPMLDESLSKISRMDITELELDFTLPSDPNYLLVENGDNVKVNNENIETYLELVVDAYVGSGVSKQVEAFKNGFSKILDLESFSPFDIFEIQCILSELLTLIKADHGYTQNSRILTALCEMLVKFDYNQKRAFLSFVTGSPVLPLGGLKNLNPVLTIVRKSTMKNENPDLILPSVMTCAHYLKVPEYSNTQVMTDRFLFAMYEGKESFHLS